MTKLTKKERDFAVDYIDTGNGTKSALKVYDTKDPNTAGVIAHGNLRKPKILAFLSRIATDAVSRMEELSKSATSEAVRYAANKDILDRAGFQPTQKIQDETAVREVDRLRDDLKQLFHEKEED